MPQYFGKYRAFVRDTADPDDRGRVRLEIPAVLGPGPSCWSGWAWPCLPWGGMPDAGMYFVPPVGATVWAEFEAGDPRHPIWTGVWYGGQVGEQPTEGRGGTKTHVLFKSLSGHTITLSDRGGEESIAIRDSAGQVFLMEAWRKRITLRDASESEIIMDGLAGNIVARPTNMLVLV